LLLLLVVLLLAVKNISWICVLQADAQNIDSCLPEIKLYPTFPEPYNVTHTATAFACY